ncbi:MAG TPA: nitroreductase [Dehalococcoidia bacterium]|nr:nitroreductase [Dehalococcoidia bacterium]
MDVITAIRERRTIGTFSDAPVSHEVVARLIESAIWAPTHRNTEPWRFCVVAGAARTEMADAVAAELTSGAGAEGAAQAARDKLLRAPVFVVVGQDRSDIGKDATRDLEDYAACSCATQNLLLAAQAEGLAAKWSTGKLTEYASVKRFLGLAESDRIVGYVYLGESAMDTIPTAARRPAVVDWRGL